VAQLTDAPIALEALVAEMSRPDCGALAVFLGTTRDHHGGRRVTSLAYEAYEPMALARMEALEREAKERFPIERCQIVHRLGQVPVGEASVVVVVAAHHRGPAFDACRWAMDELKAGVPIWKKESYEEGEPRWVEGTPLG
jgi:molybdopterin synthase catalytic subunit